MKTHIGRLALTASAAAILAGLASPVHAQSAASDFTTGYRYNKSGQVTGTISPDPDSTGVIKFAAVRNTYDAWGRLTKVETGELATWQSEAVAPSAWTGFTVFRTVDNTYDASGRRTKEAVSAGGAIRSVVQTSYNGVDQPVCVAQRMNPSTFASPPSNPCSLATTGLHGADRITRTLYDTAGRVSKVQKAYGTSSQQDYVAYTYTPNGKQLTVTDANGTTAQYVYDGHDRLSRWRFPSKTTAGVASTTDYEEYGYDGASNRTSLRKRDGQQIAYTHDALNRVSLKNLPGTTTGDVYYRYDNRGLQLSARFGSTSGTGIVNAYDGPGRLTSSTNNLGTSLALTYQHDKNGNRTRVTHPDGNYFSYEYDGLDRLVAVRENGVTALSTLAYNERSELTSDARSGGGVTYAYDTMSRPSSETIALAGTTGDLTIGLTYNSASQIVTRARSNVGYVFDGASPGTQFYRVNGLNQYVAAGSSSPTHDANGNLTSYAGLTMAYDVENRLVSTSGSKVATLSYDPLGRLWQTIGGGVTTRFLYDGDELVAEYNGSNALQRRYVHGIGVDDPIVWYEGAPIGTNRRQLVTDHQGSVIAVADNAGTLLSTNNYDDWGVPDTGNLGRFQFTGQAWIPEIGMYYYKTRIYAPGLGRFLQTDPVGYDDQINLYAYVANNPINGRDPTGRYTCLASANCEQFESARLALIQARDQFSKGSAEYSRIDQSLSVIGEPGKGSLQVAGANIHESGALSIAASIGNNVLTVYSDAVSLHGSFALTENEYLGETIAHETDPQHMQPSATGAERLENERSGFKTGDAARQGFNRLAGRTENPMTDEQITHAAQRSVTGACSANPGHDSCK